MVLENVSAMRLEYFSVTDCLLVRILLRAEVFMTFINLGVYSGAVYVVLRAPFHINLVLLLLTIIVHFYIAMISRLLTLFAILGLIPVGDDPNSDILLIICSFLRMFFFCNVSFSLSSLYIERRVATIFLADYECKPRRFISFILIAYMTIGSSICSLVIVFDLAAWEVMVVIAVLQSLFITGRFWWLARHNRRMLKDLNKGRNLGKYSLSLRFQLEENLRAMKLMRNVFLMLVLVNVFSCAVYMIAHLPSVRTASPSLWQSFEIIFNIIVNLDGYLVPLTVLISDDLYKRILKQSKIFSWVVFWWRDEPNTTTADSKESLGNVYFSTLQLQWDQYGRTSPTAKHPRRYWRKSRTGDYRK